MINSVVNRKVTLEKLKELGIKNPYTDLVESYWGYADLIEATVKHAAADWHELTYNDGKFNVLIEKYVDKDGNEISESISMDGKENTSPKKFDKYTYHGYIHTVTCLYNKGTTDMAVKKSVDKADAKVGDRLTYTVEVSNSDKATDKLTKVSLKDALPEFVDFVDGSLQLDGKTAVYGYNAKNRELTVDLDSIEPNTKKTVTFSCIVNNTAYGKSFKNTAVASAENDQDKPDTDNGVDVEDGKAKMTVVKSVDKAAAKVGDTLVYTVKVSNADTATVPLKNTILKDSLPEFVKFGQGSVHVDGKTAAYNYDNAGKLLTIELGDIDPGKTKTVTFECVIEANAYGQSFKNTAVADADNTDEIPGTDSGVDIEGGKAKMSVAKSVSKDKAKVGDTLVYTVKISNADAATVPLKNTILKDSLPEYVKFAQGSVHVDGKTAAYNFDNAGRLLTVELGDIAPGRTKTVTFECAIEANAYGQSFKNTAVADADNTDETPGTDGGVDIEDGKAKMSD